VGLREGPGRGLLDRSRLDHAAAQLWFAADAALAFARAAQLKPGTLAGRDMTNHTWVCFDCRRVARRMHTPDAAVRCSSCGEACICLGTKVPVPPRTSVSAWRNLNERVRQTQISSQVRAEVVRVRQRHKIEKTIAELESHGLNASRTKQIRALRDELSRL